MSSIRSGPCSLAVIAKVSVAGSPWTESLIAGWSEYISYRLRASEVLTRNTSLKPLAEPMNLTTPEDYHATMARRMALAPGPEVVLIGEKSKAFTRNLLTLSILVQNRRKDDMKVLVFGSRIQLVSLASTKDAFVKGRPEVDKFHTFQDGGCAYMHIYRVVRTDYML